MDSTRQCKSTGCKITRVEITDDNITGRGGLLFILRYLEKIKICTGYEYEGQILKDFPADLDIVQKAKPVYIEMDGWQSSTRGETDYDRLPAEAKSYLMKLEDLLGVRIKYVSTGSKRDEIIVRADPLA